MLERKKKKKNFFFLILCPLLGNSWHHALAVHLLSEPLGVSLSPREQSRNSPPTPFPGLVLKQALWSWELLALQQNHYYELRNTPISRNSLKGGDSHSEGYSRGWRKVVIWDKCPTKGGVTGGMKRGKEEREGSVGERRKGGGAKKESSGLGPWNKALSQGQWNKWNKSLIQTNTGRTWILLWIKPESVGRLSNQSRMKSFLECWIWHQVDLGGQCALSQLWGLGEEGSHGLPWAHLSSGGHTGGCGVPGIPVSCFPIHHLAVVKHFLSPLWVSVFTSKK